MLGWFLGILGVVFLYTRFPSRRDPGTGSLDADEPASTHPPSGWPKVSMIIPARNEEKTIARLLESLIVSDYPDLEIIVVDDQSEDNTAVIAQSYGVTVIAGQPAPATVRGKQWACQQGADAASGELLVFTDADTWHRPDGLRRAVTFLQEQGADMVSSLPYHGGDTLWEKAMAPFHVLLIAVTAPYERPRSRRLYAIGQYLMFTRKMYQNMGGHQAVGHEIVEDLPLARRCLAQGGNYRVYTAAPLYEVQMYDSLPAFFAGWRRNFRAGLQDTTLWAPLEVAAMIAALTGAGQFFATFWTTALMVASMMLIARAASQLGRFTWPGIVCFPFAVGLFVAITAAAVFDRATGQSLQWKGRVYDA